MNFKSHDWNVARTYIDSLDTSLSYRCKKCRFLLFLHRDYDKGYEITIKDFAFSENDNTTYYISETAAMEGNPLTLNAINNTYKIMSCQQIQDLCLVKEIIK